MTAIYGVVHFDERAVERSDVDAMAGAIRYWGPDGDGTWTSRDGASVLGQLVAHNLPESIRESGPIETSDGTVLTVSARLDNREELVRELGLRDDATESWIVAAAWKRWGRATHEHLFGDWVFAAWDSAAKRLFVARDQFGHTSLYYCKSGSSFAFASSRKALFALPFVPRRLNELRLAQHLATWITDGHSTFHEEIFRLPAGHHLTVTPNDVQVTRYWFPERIEEIRFAKDSDYVERFLELYSSAVRVRMRTRGAVVSTLSAGLDSTSVTALAARHLRSADERLIAYTSVPADPEAAIRAPGRLVDEWDLAHEAAEWIGAVDHRPLRNERITPLASLERSLWLHDEPEYAAANQYWIIDLLEQSRAAGAGVVLCGQMGNGGVSWGGDQQRVLRSFLRGRWIDAARALQARRQVQKTSVLRAALSHLAGPWRAKIKNAAYRRGWMLPPTGRHLFAPGFAESIDVFARMRRDAYDPFQSASRDPIGQRMQIFLPSINPVGALWNESGAGYGLDVRDPTADVRLIEYCLGVPDDQYIRGGEDRALMRGSMDGLLPPAVRFNRRRGLQGADLVFRFRADRRATAAAIDEVTSSPLVRRYMNIDWMRVTWSSVLEEAGATVYTAAGFARALLIALFLAREPFGDPQRASNFR